MKPRFLLFLILALSILFHSFYWVGYGMGDDEIYTRMIKDIIKGTYRIYPITPEYGNYMVFQFRPVLLLATALSCKIIGLNDVGFVFAIFLSHLISIGIAYLIAKKIFNETAGIITALLVAVFPLRLVYSTTLSNDLMLSTFQAAIILLLIKLNSGEFRKTVFIFLLVGIMIALSQAIKSYSLYLLIIIIPIFLMCSDHKQFKMINAVGTIVIGWLLTIIALIILFKINSAGWADFFTAELKYYHWFTPHDKFQDINLLKSHLLYYPAMMFNKLDISPTNFKPYGYFYWLTGIALVYAILKPTRNYMVIVWWALITFLFMEFAPLKIYPYQPIHRLDRTLDLLTIPSLLLCGGFLSVLFQKNIWLKLFSCLIISFFVISSLATSIPHCNFRSDAMKDIKEVAASLQTISNRIIVSDGELFWGLYFYVNGEAAKKMKWKHLEGFKDLSGRVSWDKLERDTILIVGGSRRPDLHFNYLNQFNPPDIYKNWKLIKTIIGKNTPWRKSPLKIYLIA